MEGNEVSKGNLDMIQVVGANAVRVPCQARDENRDCLGNNSLALDRRHSV